VCGFAGIYSPTRPLALSEIGVVQDVCNRQAHRGPDASGHEIGLNLALFHRKLEITSTGAASDQPFGSGDFRCAFAGEIYNHRALGAEFGVANGMFDGRVIPAGFAREGINFLSRIEGEFALAIGNPRRNEIFLARDRAGARSLYFSKLNHDCWIFSTELSALVKGASIRPEIDDNTILGQLILQEWTPRLGTYFSNILQVQPGTMVTLGPGPSHVETYPYDLSDTGSRADIFASAVRGRVEHSQAAKGCLAFSGGLDSTAIAALSGASATSMPTFTVVSGLDDPIAVRVSRLAEEMPWLQPSLVCLRSDEISNAWLTELTDQLASPICDTTPFALSSLLTRARSEGFRYCLSGEGSDDLWAGYEEEVPFLDQISIVSAYKSLIDRASENCIVDFASAHPRKIPLIHRDAAQCLTRHLNECGTSLYNAATAQSRQVFNRPLAVLSVLGPLRRSLEQVDCLAGLNSMEVRVPFCSAGLMSWPWQADWREGKRWVHDVIPNRVSAGRDWKKSSFATRHFGDTALNQDLDLLVDEVLATQLIVQYLDPAVDGSVLRMLAAANSKLWWSMVGIARFCSLHRPR